MIVSQDEGDKLIVAEKGDLVFVFNFHPTNSYQDYRIGTKHAGPYKVPFVVQAFVLLALLCDALAVCCTLTVLHSIILSWQQESDLQNLHGRRLPCHRMRLSLAATRTSARSTMWLTRHRWALQCWLLLLRWLLSRGSCCWPASVIVMLVGH